MNKIINYPQKATLLIHQRGIINNSFSFLEDDKKYLLVTDSNLYQIYKDLFDNKKLESIIVINSGDEHKSLENYTKIISRLQESNFTKNDCIIAFGGGMISDICLFVAATYQRGMDIILIPTSLLAMVDASIGGKCGLNYQTYKNQIGTYYFPSKIIIDEELLNTLPTNEYNNGFSEIIKYSIIKDAKMFSSIVNNKYKIDDLISRCIDIKLEIIKEDMYDSTLRKLLNFGHTYGHIVESASNYKLSHGHCVAIGMYKETSNQDIKNQIYLLLSKYFNLDYQLDIETIKKYLVKDKKRTNQTIDVVLIEEIGKAKIVTKKVEDLINEYLW